MERVKKLEKYWCVQCEYDVYPHQKVDYEKDTTAEHHYKIGNYFATQEEAEAMAKKIRAVLKGAEVIDIPKYEDELNAATNVYHQKGYSEGEYCHEQSFAWGFQEGIDWLKSKLTMED